MSWYTAKVLQITKESKSNTVDEKNMFSTKSTTVTETSYYLVVEIDGKPLVLVGNPTSIPQLPLLLVDDTITFNRPYNSGRYGFAQMSIHFDKRK